MLLWLPMHTHDDIMRRLRKVVSALDPAVIVEAFVASLHSAPLRYRSTLDSWASVALLPEHDYVELDDNSGCGLCGVHQTVPEGASALIEQKEKGSCIGYPSVYAALIDLEHFRTLEPVRATEADRALLQQAIEIAAQLPPTARATQLLKALRVVEKRPAPREMIAQTLAAVGVLRTPDQPSPTERMVSYWEKNAAPNLASDLAWPLRWWTAECGVSTAAVNVFFPWLEGAFADSTSSFEREIDLDTSTVVPGVRGKRSALSLRRGNLLAIEYGSHVFLGVVHGSLKVGSKTLPVFEFLQGVFDEVPDLSFANAQPARLAGPFASGHRFRRERIAVDGLCLLGKVWEGNLQLLGDVDASHFEPNDIPVTAGCHVIHDRNLLYFIKQLRVEAKLALPSPG